jgi:hypothetical protein
MKTYDYDRDNAEKVYEYLKYKRTQHTLGKYSTNLMRFIGAVCGLTAAYLARPFQRNMEAYNALYRKPWFKLPIYGFAFGCAYYGGIQLPARVFPKLNPRANTGVDHAVYTSS